MNKHILVTEDDKNVADGLREILESDGYTVSCADCASAAMQTMRDGGADLVILDVRLGQDDGYELCRRIREFSNVSILFLTACSSEIELVRGFRAGGDDYVAKPFRMHELLVRIEALLRRTSKKSSGVLRTGELSYDSASCRIRRKGNVLELTATETKLAAALITHSKQTVSREELLYLVWDKDSAFVDANTLSVNISRLRDKLGKVNGKPYIETVRGIGYRWTLPVTEQ